MSILSDRELHERYDEFLDEVYPDCKIGGLDYSTSHALKEVDPTAYRCGFADWLDSCLGESLWELPAEGQYTDEDPSESEAV